MPIDHALRTHHVCSHHFAIFPWMTAALVGVGCGGGASDGTGGGGGQAPTIECAPVDEAGAVEHAGDLSADEVWGEGLHLVTSTVNVGAGARLRIEGCAVVRLAPDASIVVDDEALGLVAEGTASRPIVFERNDGAAAWGSLNATAPATIQLSHTTLRGGGTTLDPASADLAGATLAVRGIDAQPLDLLFVDHVTVEDSAGLGVMLQKAGFLPGSDALTVRGSGTHPVYLGVGFATNLPQGTYSDNGVDAFLLQSVGVGVYGNDEPLLHDAVVPSRGLPYQVGPSDTGADVVVGDGRNESPSALLRIEAGVELRFRGSNAALGQLRVQGKSTSGPSAPQGALVVEGTADAPVVFTSMSPAPAPGDWQGLYFQRVVDDRTGIDHAEIRFAGGESTTTGVCVASPGASSSDADCAVVVYTDDPPPSSFLRESTIADSAGCGVYRGWSGAEVDFVAGNTFSGLAGCEQSNVPTENNDCSNGACQ